MQSPEGQSREKDERGPNSVVPFRLVDIYLHIIRICLQKYKNILYFCRQIRIIAKEMKKTAFLLVIGAVLCACSGKNAQSQTSADTASNDSIITIDVKYATGFSVCDSADVRLVDVGKNDHFALVQSDDVSVPNGYTKIRVPIRNTICMTALQLSNFTILDAHDVVKGITGTKNLFNKDILARVKDGRIVKIGMEGNFDTELVLAANPDVIFISPSKRGGYDAIKETGITLVPHLGYQELDPLGQAEWIKFVGMFIGKEREANDVFAGIESRYNDLKERASKAEAHPTVFSGEMHYGNWHAVGGKNYLAQIFRDAGADYVINDEETAGEDLEFEKMYALAAKADYWRILNSFPGEFTYEALKASEPRNELFKAYKEKKVIYCNMKQQAYYEISPVQPDVLLKDFVAIFHPELVEPDYEPTYYRQLK
jgi:iron complex transport system substrate-binding protein